MKRKLILLLLACSQLWLPVAAADSPTENQQDARYSITPKNGFLPNSETAEGVAELILSSIYSRERILRQKPYQTSLRDGVWTVEGTRPANQLGGTFLIQLSQADARVIRVTHEK